MLEAVKKNPDLLRDFDKKLLMVFFSANVNPTAFDKADLLDILAGLQAIGKWPAKDDNAS
jgi:hypothetical protein